nr:MAG TPA: hypothetical protein [Caudoviricetes sp.]
MTEESNHVMIRIVQNIELKSLQNKSHQVYQRL